MRLGKLRPAVGQFNGADGEDVLLYALDPAEEVGAEHVLFQDSFTDTNGTTLTAHTPEVDCSGGGWQDSVIPSRSSRTSPAGRRPWLTRWRSSDAPRAHL